MMTAMISMMMVMVMMVHDEPQAVKFLSRNLIS